MLEGSSSAAGEAGVGVEVEPGKAETAAAVGAGGAEVEPGVGTAAAGVGAAAAGVGAEVEPAAGVGAEVEPAAGVEAEVEPAAGVEAEVEPGAGVEATAAGVGAARCEINPSASNWCKSILMLRFSLVALGSPWKFCQSETVRILRECRSLSPIQSGSLVHISEPGPTLSRGGIT